MADVKKIEALLELGWSHRRIAREVRCWRETVARYQRLREENRPNPIAGSVDLEKRPNPIAGSEIELPTSGPDSTAHPHRDFIAHGVKRGLSALRIWQDLVAERGYTGGYLTVQRYVRHDEAAPDHRLNEARCRQWRTADDRPPLRIVG
jgi:transposase